VKARILVVEDDQIIQLDLRLSLKQLGYEVVGAVSSGEEAITKAAQLQPDLILMDIRLRGAVDGIEAASRIQSAHNLPVLYLSAQSGYELVGRVVEPRITKPFNQRTLQAGIEQALAGKKL
jgi:CheY-like chemotaxis protein